MSDAKNGWPQLRLVFALISGNLASTVLNLLSTLIIARCTPPNQLGLWNLMTVIITYASAMQLGVFNAMNRQIPFLRGSGDSDKEKLIGQIGLSWCIMLTAITVVLGLIVVSYFAVLGTRDQMLTAIAFVSVLAGSWSLQYLTIGYTSYCAFGSLARRNTLIAGIGLPLAAFAWAFGYSGLLLRVVLISLTSGLVLYFRCPLRVQPKWDYLVFIQLVRIGFPVWILGQTSAMFMTLDRLVLSGSPELLGYYSITAQFAAVMVIVPTAVNAVLYPRMSHNYGLNQSAMELLRMAAQASMCVFIIGAFLAVVCWITIPYLLSTLLPNYTLATGATSWASLVVISMVFSPYGNILNVLGRQEFSLLSSAVGLGSFFTSWHLLTKSLDAALLVSAIQSMLVATFSGSFCSMLICFWVCRRMERARAHLIGHPELK